MPDLDLTDAELRAARGWLEPIPADVLDAAQGVFELAEVVGRRERANPFADLANLDDEDLNALHERVRSRFRAICTTIGGGAGVAP